MQVARHGHVDQSNGRREREKEMDLSDIYWSKFHKNLDGICSNNNNIVLLLQGCQNYERKRFTVLLYCVFNDCRMYSDSPYFIPDLGDLCLLFIFVFVVKGFLDFFDLKKNKLFPLQWFFLLYCYLHFLWFLLLSFLVFLFLLVLGLFCSLFFYFPKAETKVSDLGSFKIFHVYFAINFTFSTSLAIYNIISCTFVFILFYIFLISFATSSLIHVLFRSDCIV